MAKRMLIDARHSEETRVVIADDRQIFDFDFASVSKKQLKGNIYLAKITRVEPSLQAAFVEYGGNKQGFLPFSEIHPDYYQIPSADRKRLLEEVSKEDSIETAAEEIPTTQPESEEPDNKTEIPPDQLPFSHADRAEDRPAYLMQGAIDTSVSEPIETAEAIPSSSEDNPSDQLPSDPSLLQGADSGQNVEPSVTQETGTESVETLQNEEEEIQQRRPKRSGFQRRYKIQEVIRRGQIVLVQVIKEERGNKGVSLTTYLSLAGRYCVLMPNSPKDGGISRKIASAEDRKRLKALSTEFKLAQGMSVIIRTAGMDRTRAEIKRDYDYLVKLWNRIREDTLESTAPALIYEESDIIKRAIRDQYSNDIDEVVIEGDAGYKAAKEFMKLLLPSHTPKIKLYKEPTPLFYALGIEEQLLSMHDPVVRLRSGGYIVINPTEALISIDVNSGRSTGERNIEETATKTNLEAAAEVSRQLRLRDLAGLIVIDFIDMLDSRNRRAVERALKDALKSDRAKIQLGRISPFGLLEMSRQRLRPSISETNMVQCRHCLGRGYMRSNESMSIQIIRSLEKEASAGNWSGLRLIAPQDVALHLLNHKRAALQFIEERYELTIQVLIDTSLPASEFNLEKMRRSQSSRHQANTERQQPKPRDGDNAPISSETILEEMASDNSLESVESDATVQPEAAEPMFSEQHRGGRPPRRGGPRRGRRGGRYRSDETPTHKGAEELASNDNVLESGISPQPRETDDESSTQRKRGGRGRRRWRQRGDARAERQDNEATATAFPPAASQPRAIPSAPSFVEPAQAVNAPAAIPESTPRDPNAPPKKGWWQKIIELE